MILPLLLSAPGTPSTPAPGDAGGESVRFYEVQRALTVDATVGGVSGRFLVSTAFPATYVNPDLLTKLTPDDSGTVAVSIGAVRLGRATPRAAAIGAKFPGVSGVIGAECLREFAVGIDVDAGEFRFWPRASDPAEMEAWIRTAVPDAEIGRLPLNVQADGPSFLRAKIGGRSGWFCLDTTVRNPEVRHVAAPDTGSKFLVADRTQTEGADAPYPVEVRATNGFGLGGDASGWTIVRRAAAEVEDVTGGADGLIDPRSILSRRLVLDTPRKTLLYDVPTLNQAIGRSISRLTTLTIRVQGERLVFIRTLDAGSDELRQKLIGAELVEYEGMPAADLLAAMRAGGERRLRVLATLSRAIKSGFKGKILLNSKRLDLNITPAD